MHMKNDHQFLECIKNNFQNTVLEYMQSSYKHKITMGSVNKRNHEVEKSSFEDHSIEITDLGVFLDRKLPRSAL